MLEITVEADTNDADYVTRVSKISEEDLEKIKPLIAAIKAFVPYDVMWRGSEWYYDANYPLGGCLRQDLGEKRAVDIYPHISEDVHEKFVSYVPHGDIHSITSITISPYVEKTILL